MRFKSNTQRKAVMASLMNKSFDDLKRSGVKLKPIGDADRDGVKNKLDCKPLDPKRHIVIGRDESFFAEPPGTQWFDRTEEITSSELKSRLAKERRDKVHIKDSILRRLDEFEETDLKIILDHELKVKINLKDSVVSDMVPGTDTEEVLIAAHKQKLINAGRGKS